MTVDTAPRSAPPEPEAGGSRQRRTAAIVAVLAVVVACWAWWSNPRLFSEPGNVVGATTQTGETLYVGMGIVPDGESVHLVDTEPRIVHNRDAFVGVLVCDVIDVHLMVGVVTAGEVDSICSSLRAPTGRVDGTDQIVLEVSSDRSGVVVVEGVDVTYRTPYQRGTQATGPTVEIVVTDAP